MVSRYGQWRLLRSSESTRPFFAERKSSQAVKTGNPYSRSTTSTTKKMRKTQQDELLHRWPSNTPKSPVIEKAPNWENIFETHITNKRFICRLHKEIWWRNNKKTNNPTENEEYNPYQQSRNCQSPCTTIHHFTPTGQEKIKPENSKC